MKKIHIPTYGTLIGYEWSDLTEEARERAINDTINFEIEIMDENSPYYYLAEKMERMQTPWFLGEAIMEAHREDIIETLIINEYLFDFEGDILPLTHYVGKHEKAGQVEYKGKYIATISDVPADF